MRALDVPIFVVGTGRPIGENEQETGRQERRLIKGTSLTVRYVVYVHGAQ